jgi:hypothetical protein
LREGASQRIADDLGRIEGLVTAPTEVKQEANDE